MKSDRFERKGLIRKNRNDSGDVVVAQYRAPQDAAGAAFAIQAGHDGVIQNLETLPLSFETDGDVLSWLCAIASQAPSARILLKEAQEEGWDLRLDEVSQGGFSFDEDNNTVLLDHFGFTANALGRSAHFRNALFLNFVKALRELWHERNGHDFESTHRPEAILMLERARNADCAIMAVLAGWELRGAGHADVWRSLLGSETGDLAMVFTQAIEKDPAGFYDGSVLTRTFCQWYDDEDRVAASDHSMLERMDEWLEDAKGAQVFGAEPLRAADIEKISILPGGRAYLDGMGRNVCTDPYFTAIDDVINESHLFQIVYDSKIVLVGGVPFRDKRLADLIFPGELVSAAE